MDERHLFNKYNISNEKLDLKINDLKIKNAKDLINCNRLDLIAKYIYVEAKDSGVNIEYSKELYKAHIKAFTHGEYFERGQEDNKNSIDAFYEVFDKLIVEISKYGFNYNISKIPIDKNGVLIDGAHRVSICAFYNLAIKVTKFNTEALKFNYVFFKKRMLEPKYLDYIINRYVGLKKNSIYAMCLWPCAFQKNKIVREILDEHLSILYEKEIILNSKGAHSFIAQIYHHHDWVGSPLDKFSGAQNKADNCFGNYKSPITLFFLETDLSFLEILKLKDKIRKNVGLDKHSVHITDNFEETKQISELLLNKNSIYQLNYGSPLKFKEGVERIIKFKKYLQDNNWSLENVLVDGSCSMEMFGIRKADDVDFISNQTIPKKEDFNQRSQSELLKLYGGRLDDLNSPESYFYYFRLKFTTLNTVFKSKENRGEKKDKKDSLLIKEFLSSNKISKRTEAIFLLNRRAMMLKRKIRLLVSKTLKALGLFKILKKMISKINDN